MVFVSQTPKLRTNKGFYRHGASTDSTSRPDGTNENEVESGVSSAVGGSPNLFSDHAIAIATSNHGGQGVCTGVLLQHACRCSSQPWRTACLIRISSHWSMHVSSPYFLVLMFCVHTPLRPTVHDTSCQISNAKTPVSRVRVGKDLSMTDIYSSFNTNTNIYTDLNVRIYSRKLTSEPAY